MDERTDILVIDDDQEVADILRELLTGKDKTVDVAYGGLEAIEKIQKGAYDLIIVDLVMPGVGGLDILKYAKQVNPDIIVIILTGYASLETAIAAIRDGAYDYIRKPCKLEEIKIVVENAIDKIRLYRENGELLRKLQDAYNELVVLREGKQEGKKIASINFFSSNMPTLHYLFNNSSAPNNCVDKLEALSSLKERGVLNESEFKAFKEHLLKSIRSEK